MSEAMTEFRITSDLSALRGQVIEANFEEVHTWLDENLAPYREMAVTPDTVATAKTYRASIRKVKDRIDQSRKEAKAAALAAYTDFEAKCKALTGLCDEAANAIDEQVKALEEADAQKKIEALQAEYVAMTDDEIEHYLPWGVINNPKWANKTYSFEQAKAEIAEAIDGARSDLDTIRSMGGNDTPYLLDVYRQTRSISAVVRKASELKTMREREEQREREAERIRQAQASNAESAKTSGAVYEPQPGKEEMAQAEMYCVSFRVSCTKGQLIALGQYMREQGIHYEKV